jgi:hypothetical protein
MRQTDLRVDSVNVITSGTVIVALIFAVAMVSQWLPVNAYTMGIVASSSAGFITAKPMKPKRPRPSGIRFPRDRGWRTSIDALEIARLPCLVNI